MYTFTTLHGVSGKVKGPLVPSIRGVKGVMTTLKVYRACSMAGENGCITAWIDDAGLWRFEFHREQTLITEGAFKTKLELKERLTAWVPHLKVGQDV